MLEEYVASSRVRAEMRRTFLQQVYQRRALIETLFSSAEHKPPPLRRARWLRMQMRQVLVLGLSLNLTRLKHRRRLFLRMSTEPDKLYPAFLDLILRVL